MEEWKDIKGYEGIYQASTEGRVKSLNYRKTKKEELLKTWLNHRDYIIVDLKKDGIREHKLVHRLIAEAFIPNSENKPTVNHINHIRTDNRLENLEWATYSEQNDDIWREKRAGFKHSEETKKKISDAKKGIIPKCNPTKQVYQYTLDGKLVKIWPSAHECGRNGFSQGNICNCCNGKLKHYKGHIWSYKPL